MKSNAECLKTGQNKGIHCEIIPPGRHVMPDPSSDNLTCKTWHSAEEASISQQFGNVISHVQSELSVTGFQLRKEATDPGTWLASAAR